VSSRVAIGLAALLASSGLAAVVAAPPAGAATTTITVDNFGDGVPDATPCLTPIPGQCTLRDAFFAASTVGTDVEIDVPGGSGQTISLVPPFGAPFFAPADGTDSLTVHGNGVTIDQTTTNAQVLVAVTSGSFTLDGVTLTGGNTVGFPTGPGAALLNTAGPITLSNSTVSGNTAAPPSGGAGAIIAAGVFSAPVTLDNVTVTDNQITTTGRGADFGIVEGSSVAVTNSRFTNNTDTANFDPAGGVIDAGPDPSTVTGSTFTGNTNAAQNGSDEADGVLDTADTTVTNSTFTANTVSATTGEADGVLDTADTTLTASLVAGNTISSGDDAFAAVFPNQLTMTASTVANNTVTGGAVAAGGGVVTTHLVNVQNSTITNNTASGPTANGGGIDQDLNFLDLSAQTHDGHWSRSHADVGAAQTTTGVNLTYATVVDNTATTGANLRVSSLETSASVVALPHGGANCVVAGAITSAGYNFSDDASCQLTATGDLQNAGDPGLAALASAGGPTPTRVPHPTSLLVDAIPVAVCQTIGVFVDQRGVTRPQGHGCDIGAVEIVPPPPPVPRFTG
jgi:hypothetical protein